MDAVYIIGGRWTQDIVAEFKNDQWHRLANLNQGRYLHGSITIGGQTMIIGGTDDNQTFVYSQNFEVIFQRMYENIFYQNLYSAHLSQKYGSLKMVTTK